MNGCCHSHRSRASCFSKHRRFPALQSIVAFCLFATSAHSASKLAPFAIIEALELRECSGIVKSRAQADTFWTHNDSGGGANLFAIQKNGSLIGQFPTPFTNIDWEDIATDNSGNLFIGDFGNFANTRRDLAIHRIAEPKIDRNDSNSDSETFPFEYPDQVDFPPKRRLYDCEALFWANGRLFLLTKSLGEVATRLYRFDTLRPDHINKPTLVGSFDIGPRVTAADASPTGDSIAILTTRSVWVFERPKNSDNYLDGPAKFASIQAGQCEAVTWISDGALLIANESRELFQITLDSLIEY